MDYSYRCYPYNYTKNIEQELDKNSPDLFICGHSHILKVMYDKNREILHMNQEQQETTVFIKSLRCYDSISKKRSEKSRSYRV